MLRFAYAALVGIIGAGIVHIAIVLMVPAFSDRDAWSRLAAMSDLNRFVRLGAERGALSSAGPMDPLFAAAACRFNLDDGAVHVQAAGKVPFWSVSVYDREGQNIYSFNERTSAAGALDFVVLTPAQMVEVRKEVPEEFQQSVFVEAPVEEGIILVRVFTPDASWSRITARFIEGMTCDPA